MVVSDFNQDGWPDVVLGNLDSELRAFLNDGGTNNWVKVQLPDTPSSIGAIARLETASGKQYVRQFYTSEGLSSDQTSALFFGLGEETALKQLTIEFQNGSVTTFDDLEANTTIEAQAAAIEAVIGDE